MPSCNPIRVTNFHTFACCCCGCCCCWGMVFASGVCPSIRSCDLLLTRHSTAQTAIRLHGYTFTSFSAKPGLGQPPGSIPTTPLWPASRQLSSTVVEVWTLVGATCHWSALTFIEPFRYYFVVFESAGWTTWRKPHGVGRKKSSIWDCRSRFEISIYEFEWVYMKFRHFVYSVKPYLAYDSNWKHSLYSWVGMLWFHRFRKLFDLLEVYESDWDVLLDHPSRFLTWLRTSEMLMKPVLLPLASIWDTLALWGQCLRILFEVLRHCEDNAYVSSWPLDFIWKSSGR